MDSISFKKVTSGDRDDIHAIYNILKACGENMFNRYGLEHWINPYTEKSIERDTENKEVYIVSLDNRKIATFMISKTKSEYFSDETPAVYISKVATLPEEEGKGIGGKCIDFIEARALTETVSRIRLDVYTKSERAINFYKNKGFIVTDEKPTRRFSVYCMEKVLEL